MKVYNMNNSLRITIGNNSENKKFIKTIRKIILCLIKYVLLDAVWLVNHGR